MPTEDPKLFLLGSSHKVASLVERELISLPADKIEPFYKGLRSIPGMKECLLLNTCNRTEIYGVGNGTSPIDEVRNYLSNFQKLEKGFMDRHFYQREGEEVVRHLFEVTSGIDSQMVGETEILGQVKKAYEDACNRKLSGKTLNRLFQKGFQTAKWTRTNTGISRGQVNLGNVLSDLARRIFGKVENCRLLIVGAGDVAESTMESFQSRGCQEITVTGRTFDWCPLSRRKPDELADKFGGFAMAYDGFQESLHLFDVILTSTSSGTRMITADQVKHSMKKRPAKPLFLIDASVPRNIDERVAKIDNVFLYNMDDVSAIANENLKLRMAEVDQCRETLANRALKLWAQMVDQPSKQPSLINQSANPQEPGCAKDSESKEADSSN
ncbi:glutamyl-tRNA reductase [Verrucomicrobia bacterium]|nr:glutamyl-tRNA reductase [Verrucomicrobiota bacterium]